MVGGEGSDSRGTVAYETISYPFRLMGDSGDTHQCRLVTNQTRIVATTGVTCRERSDTSGAMTGEAISQPVYPVGNGCRHGYRA